MGHDLKTSASPMWRQSSELAIVETLLFKNISVEYNNTNIQCRATFDNGDTADSNDITLLVQGERNDYILREPHTIMGMAIATH